MSVHQLAAMRHRNVHKTAIWTIYAAKLLGMVQLSRVKMAQMQVEKKWKSVD